MDPPTKGQTLNKGHRLWHQLKLFIVLTTGIMIRTSHQDSLQINDKTVEPPNKGHFGSGDVVLYLEAVLWWEVRITIVSTSVITIGAVASVLYLEVVLSWKGPL